MLAKSQKIAKPAKLSIKVGYYCLNCKKKLKENNIKITGCNDIKWEWEYYIECLYCGYENNIAKLKNLTCTCQ